MRHPLRLKEIEFDHKPLRLRSLRYERTKRGLAVAVYLFALGNSLPIHGFCHELLFLRHIVADELKATCAFVAPAELISHLTLRAVPGGQPHAHVTKFVPRCL